MSAPSLSLSVRDSISSHSPLVGDGGELVAVVLSVRGGTELGMGEYQNKSKMPSNKERIGYY